MSIEHNSVPPAISSSSPSHSSSAASYSAADLFAETSSPILTHSFPQTHSSDSYSSPSPILVTSSSSLDSSSPLPSSSSSSSSAPSMSLSQPTTDNNTNSTNTTTNTTVIKLEHPNNHDRGPVTVKNETALAAAVDESTHLTASQLIQRSYDLFVQMDKNQNHRLESTELSEAINSFVSVDRTQTEEIINIVTKGKDHSLSFAEFHTVFAALHILRNLQRRQLASGDQLNISHLSVADIRNALIDAGLSPARAQVERMFALGDKYKTYDRVGPISFLQFLEIYVNTPHNANEVFLHSWHSAGRNATPYNMPAELNPLEDFFAGTCAGIALTLVGHPFDTVKVRMQTETGFRSGLDTLLKSVNSEGVLALFKGMAGPMLTIPIVNAVVFAAYAQAKDVMHKFQKEIKPLTLSQITLAGVYAGIVNCFIVCPVELIKTRLQIQYNAPLFKLVPNYSNSSGPFITGPVTTLTSPAEAAKLHQARKAYWHAGTFSGGAVGTEAASAVEHPHAISRSAYQPFKGPLDAVTRIVQKNGIKGLYRGMSATLYREIPGYGGQFWAYEGLKRLFTREGEKVENLSPLYTIAAGGLAGLAGWVFSYPMDFVKSQIQAEPFDTKSPYTKNKWLLDGGFFSCWRETVKKGGHMALWRGFAPCAARAFPANAAGFLAYEMALKLIRKVDYGDRV